MKNKTKTNLYVLIFVTLFQIVLLINLPIAQSYSISESFNSNSNIKIEKTKKNFLNKGFSFLISFLSIKQIGIVSAQDIDDPVGCCIDFNNSLDYCEMGIERDCKPNKWKLGEKCGPGAPTTISECEIGNCYDKTHGTCSKTAKWKCDSPGEFLSLTDSKCDSKCCIVGNNMNWFTERQCENWALSQGFTKESSYFPEVASELECKAKLNMEVKGACVDSIGQCDYPVMKKNCLGDSKFYEKKCTELATEGVNCKSTENKKCFPELGPAVYKIDSCGNVDGVAEGKDCDGLSTECGYNQNGEIGCVDITCKYDTNNNGTIDSNEHYKNGEQWCIFDSLIGNQTSGGINVSADTPGSTHWIASCVDGEVDIDACSTTGDREYVCVGQNHTEEGEESYRTASCEMNRQSQCLMIMGDYQANVNKRIENGEDVNTILEDERIDLKNKCEANLQCNFREIQIGDKFKFPACVGKYPHGNLGCGFGTRTCKVIFRKDFWGQYKCKYNCQCLHDQFVERMNDFCVSLGDCGSYVNYNGTFTNNINIKVKPEKLDAKSAGAAELRTFGDDSKVGFVDTGNTYVPLNKLEGYINETLKNRYVGKNKPDQTLSVPGLYDEYIKNNSYSKLNEIFGQSYNNMWDDEGWLGKLSLGAGAINLGAYGCGVYGSGGHLVVGAGGKSVSGIGHLATPFATYALPIMGAIIGAMIGNHIAKLTGQGGAGQVGYIVGFGIAGATGAAYLGTLLFHKITTSTFGGPQVLIAAMIVAAVITAYTAITGAGKTKTVDVTFECNEWEPPFNGDNCEYCNQPGMTCTEYKCHSLGQACKIINPGSQYPLCIGDANDETPPNLTTDKIQTGYSFTPFDEEDKISTITNATEEGSRIWFSLNTDEPAQCKYSFKRSINYNSMESNYPSGINALITEHNFTIEIPTLFDLGISNGDSTTLYVKCQDNNGNFNLGDGYKINMTIKKTPDTTAPIIKTYQPESEKSYPYNPGKLNVRMYTDEETECKWDYAPKDYSEMNNSFSPSVEATYNNFLQMTNFSNFVQGENTFYIKCSDNITSGKNNIGSGEYHVNILEDISIGNFTTQHGLKISSVSPDSGTIIRTNQPPVSLDMQVTTTDGANEGNAICKYKLVDSSIGCGNYNNIVNNFFETGTTSHTQTFDYLMSSGNYTLCVLCRDLDRITNATTQINFTLDIDTQGPTLSNYTAEEGGDLTITLNEPAKCAYSTNITKKFNFELDDEKVYAFDFGYDFKINQSMHPFYNESYYYINCIDDLGNLGNIGPIGKNNSNNPIIIGNNSANTDNEDGKLKITLDEPAKCYYNNTDYNFNILQGTAFDFGNEFKINQTTTTKYNPTLPYYIKCVDRLGNEGEAGIINAIGSEAPVVTRIYFDSGNLKINTNKLAICYYGFNNCGFNLTNNPNKMSSDLTQIHSTLWNPATKYYIRCKDEWGTENIDKNGNKICAAIIEPNSF